MYSNFKKEQANFLPSDSPIMPQEIYQIGVPITIVYNESCRSKPKEILQNLNPCPFSQTFRWCRTWPRACVILKVITTWGIPLAVPLPHISAANRRPTRHNDTQMTTTQTTCNTRVAPQNQQNHSNPQTKRWIQFSRNLVEDNQTLNT